MNFAKSLAATLILAAASLAPAAHATVIDFNHLAGTSVPGGSVNPQWTQLGATFTTNGFKFTGASYSYLIGAAYANAYYSGDAGSVGYNGTDYYMSYQQFVISRATATPFKVNSLDLDAWFDNTGVTQATLTGTKIGGGTITQIINLSPLSNQSKHVGNDFVTYALTGFDGLSSLTISHNGYSYLALDNLVVDAATVPEPSSLALFGLAIAGCAFMRRRAENAA